MTTIQQKTLSYQQTTSLEEETNIEEVSYAGGKNYYLIGKFVGQEFSAMEKPTKREWSVTAPNWRKAVDGLNLEGNLKLI
jgi:lipopolysaccharide assembly outer membrane protein LptD (OstA)